MAIAFSAIQEDFAAALLDADRPVPIALASNTVRAPQKRFGVYRNNVVVGLVAALRAQFPATDKIVGEEFFAAMARVYVTSEPPRSPILVTYGGGFPGFIARFVPAAELLYLADVARLEVARTRAYHAADAASLDSSSWQELDPGTLFEARLTLHPSVQIVRSAHPIVTIWSMNSGENALGSIEDCEAEDALVSRPHLDVQVHRLPVGGAAFLGAIATGASLGEAAGSAAAAHPEFDLATNLAGLIGAGLAIELRCTSTRKDIAP